MRALLLLCLGFGLLACTESKPKPPPPAIDPAKALVDYERTLKEIGVAPTMVTKFALRGKEVILTVDNGFHRLSKPERLSAAQNLWRGWAQAACPGDLDSCHVRLVDQNGNKVGGSGMVGSFVSVND